MIAVWGQFDTDPPIMIYGDIRRMTPRRMTTFRIDDELLDALRGVYERDGIQISEQVRRAIRLWLESKAVSVEKSDRKRAKTRKRS